MPVEIAAGDDIFRYLSSRTGGSARDKDLFNLLLPIGVGMIRDFVGFQIDQATFTEWYPDRQIHPLHNALVDDADRGADLYDVSGNQVVQYGTGGNNQAFAVRNLPLRSITFLWENANASDTVPPTFSDEHKLTEGQHYVVDYSQSGLSWTGLIFRKSGSWPFQGSHRPIQVQYVAGFTEAEIKAQFPMARWALMITLRKLISEAKANEENELTGAAGGPITAEHLDSWGANYDTTSMARNLGLSETLPVGAKKALEPYVNYARYV